MKNEELPTCPVEGWDIGLAKGMQSVIFRLTYSAHPLQSADAPIQTPTMALNAQIAIELSEALKKYALLAMQGSHGDGLTKH
jgi:hypothetical protein